MALGFVHKAFCKCSSRSGCGPPTVLAPSAAAARGRRNGLPVRAVKTEASQPYGEHASKFSSMERHVQTELIAFSFSPLTVYSRCFPRSLLITVLRTWLLRPAGLPFLFHSATLLSASERGLRRRRRRKRQVHRLGQRFLRAGPLRRG